MAEGIVALMIPITISLGAFMMIWGIRYFENKENMAMIEKGLDPKKRRTADPSRTLRNALMFMGAGLGLLLAIVITKIASLTDGEATGTYFALIAIGGGLGMFLAYMYERKNPPSHDEL
ncbi:MAG TPA: hypothetical protein PKL15_21190 [Saprospiraceae bacterium]|nr:hypothetical protein [Saprospiraceae bacterium]